MNTIVRGIRQKTSSPLTKLMSTSASTQPVLIVGSGPSGLVMALSLAHYGVPVRIIEKQTNYSRGFRGTGIQPRTLELHGFLGVLPDVLEAGHKTLISRMYDLPPNGTKVLKDIVLMNYEEPTPSCPYRSGLCRLSQSAHEGILRKHLKERFNTQVELGTSLESFEQYEDHVVAHLVKADGEREDAKVAYLVGADGAKSVVRKQLGLSFEGESPAVGRMLVGDIHAEGLDHEHWHSWGEPSDKMVRITYTGNEDIYNFMVVDRSVNLADYRTDRDWAVEKIYQITGRTDVKFGDLVYVSVWKPNMRMVTEFSKGRVFIAGDAAHVHSPTGGQGLNSSVQDSFNLGWKLALCYQNLAPQTLLSSYTAERYPVISAMIHTTSKLFKQTGTKSIQDKAAALRASSALSMLGINCRGSPITVDERHDVVDLETNDFYDSAGDKMACAGDRAPDAPGLAVVKGKGREREEISLFGGVFGYTHHTILLYHADAKLGREVLDVRKAYEKVGIVTVLVVTDSGEAQEEIDVDLVVRDGKGYAHDHYGVDRDRKEPVVVVVRPDGTIGAVVTVSGAGGVRRYFEKILL